MLERLTHPDLRGVEFADTLSPVISAIGLDIREGLSFARDNSVLVEGISDHMYLSAWSQQFMPQFLEQVNLFPGTGATTLPILASLFIGWGLNFIVLLDRDKKGEETKEKFIHELAISNKRVVQPKDATGIEDLLSTEDFRSLLNDLDPSLTLNNGESPSAAIKRQKIDKILVARTYAERVNNNNIQLTKRSQDAIVRLLKDLLVAAETPQNGRA